MGKMQLRHVFEQRLLEHEGQRLSKMFHFVGCHGHGQAPHHVGGQRQKRVRRQAQAIRVECLGGESRPYQHPFSPVPPHNVEILSCHGRGLDRVNAPLIISRPRIIARPPSEKQQPPDPHVYAER